MMNPEEIKQKIIDIFQNDIFDEVDAEDNAVEFLQDKVDDLKLQEATRINNQGLDGQIEYVLKSGFTIEELLKQAERTQ